MPDISMCGNRDCPSHSKCYRFMAEPSPNWQAYGSFRPDASGKCPEFWPVENAPTALRKETPDV